ncbi:hypothetical protein D3C80_1128020 [compost metagenome]
MPGVVDSVATTKAALVFSDGHSILLDDDPISIGVNLDRAADGCRQDRIFVVVEADSAGLRHRGRNAVETIEWADVTHEAAAFGFKHLPDGLRRLFGMAMNLGIGNAFVEQPDIQLFQAFDPETRREEALSYKTDLVLDLPFLPTGCWRAGYRVHEIMAAHLQEAAIVEPFLADKDRLDRRLHVVVDATRAGATEEVEGLVVRVEDHLLALAHISPREHHPAVAEPDMRHLHRRRHALDHNDLVAPVELIGLAGRIVERHVGLGRYGTPILRPSLRIAPDRIVATVVTQRS